MQKKNRWKKWLAAILLLVMCCNIIPYQSFAAEDYRTWDQADSRWGDIELGNSGETMEDSGCLVTSVTKLIIQAGLKDAESFTPAVLVNWLNDNEGFTDGGALYWGKPAEYVDGLSYYSNNFYESGTYDIDEYTDDIIAAIEDGYHLVLQVKSGSHWVAVDEAMTLANGEIYIMDSLPSNQNADIRLEDCYSNFTRAAAYTGGTTPDGTTEEEPAPEEAIPEEPTPEEPIPEEPTPDDATPDDATLNPFVDIKETDYYYDAVLWALEKDITTGTDETHFSPDRACTRAEIVTFLWRALGCPAPATEESPFADVEDESSYYYNAVLWAQENDITTGVDDTHFDPDATCTREQIVTFLWRAEGKPASQIENPFVDVSEGQYYTEAVLWAVENDITTGTDETHFSPTDECTRAQVVTFLYRTYN